MNSKIIISQSADELSENFVHLLLNGLKGSKENFHIALSGGSTPKRVFRYIADNYKSEIEWESIKFYWGDERCVPPDDIESNYKMSNDNLFSIIGIPEKNIFRIAGENDPAIEAVNYSNILKGNIPEFNGIPRFDLIMLGLGEDGHTASIFPDSLNLFEEKNICAVAEHPATHQKRITITGKIINNAKQVIFIVTGSSKSGIVGDILNRKNDYGKYPASHVNPAQGELIWMIDSSAAGRLNHSND